MSGYKKFFVLLLSVLMLMQCASSSLAISDIIAEPYPSFTVIDSLAAGVMYMSKGETRTYTLTADNPIGEITWNLNYWGYDAPDIETSYKNDGSISITGNGDITVSATTGNSVTITGTLQHDFYSVIIEALDVDQSRTIYVVGLQNSNLVSEYSFENSDSESVIAPVKVNAYYEKNSGNSWDDAYMINSVEDFKLMAYGVDSKADHEGKYYKLGSDLDLSSETSLYVFHPFSGHFDGQGHTIRVNLTGSSLFTYTSSGDILNLNVTGTVRGVEAAGIIGFMDGGTIDNCHFDGTVESMGGVGGGIVAYSYGLIKNCTFRGTVSTIYEDLNSSDDMGYYVFAGGIAGVAGYSLFYFFNGNVIGEWRSGNSSIENCRVLAGSSINSGSASNNYSVAGGIAGYALNTNNNDVSITNCTSEASVTADTYTGGIIGMAHGSINLSGNTWPTQYEEVGYFEDGSEVIPSPEPQDDTELNVGVIEPVIINDDVIEQIASNINVDASAIRLLTSKDFDTATPPEPTDSMKQQAKSEGYGLAAKLNTINVEEDGWYVFQVTVSDDLVGTNVKNLRLYYAEGSDFANGSYVKIANENYVRAAFGLMPIINGITGSLEVTNIFGIELDTLPKQFLATMFLSAGKSLTVYIGKLLISVILGGCNPGIIGGGIVLVGGLILIKFFRKHK